MGHDWISLVRKVVYDPNNNTPALCPKEKSSIPIRNDYTEDLHSCAAERTAAHYKTEDRLMVSCFLLCWCTLYTTNGRLGASITRLFSSLTEVIAKFISQKIKSWFLMPINNKEEEVVVVFAQNRFSQLLLIAALSPFRTVSTFKSVSH